MPTSTPTSAEQSSSDERDEEPLSSLSEAQWQAQQDQASLVGTPSSSSQQAHRPALPMQKRRRVTRACDECRRKKIKCDGKQPCTHCTVYSYDCTYDQPSNRRRNPAPQYIEALEVRLHRAEALLQTYIPNIDLNDPNVDILIQQRQSSRPSTGLQAPESQPQIKPDPGGLSLADEDPQIRSMIQTTGELDIDDRGNWDFHGGSSGTVFVARMREQFGGLLGGDRSAPFLPRPVRPIPSNIDSPRSAYESPHDVGLANTFDLPTKEVALKLCHSSLERACTILRFVHQPTFYGRLNKIYDTPADQWTDEEHRFLPLLYGVLALGTLFTESLQEDDMRGESPYKALMDRGLRYFRAGRQMIDICDCRDILSLQCILFMIFFLQSSSNLSTCYSYIGLALRASLRMGLHRNLTTNFNPIERETRRRVFWIIRKMDIYVSALLGFPQMLSDDDIDQVMPSDVDDEYITKDAILPMPEGKSSAYAASNAHTTLMAILAKVIKYIYPVKGVEQCAKQGNNSYTISHAKIREIEGDLQDWLDKLPMTLRPGVETDEDIIRAQQLLRVAYAHVQMMLYRPFLHYVSKKFPGGKAVDDRSYASAAACVSVSRNIVHITTEMEKRSLLVGAYWFTMYTTFFAILSLVFYVIENPDKPGSKEILADANAGRAALKGLAKLSMAADRCSTALDGLFEKLPEQLKKLSLERVQSKKKRSAPSASAGHGGRISPDLNTQTQIPQLNASQRAATFPMPINTNLPQHQNSSYEGSRFPQNSIPDQNNYRHSYQELISGGGGFSKSGTPDSASTGGSFPAPFKNNNNDYQLQPQPYLDPDCVPDLSAMMFPSADPFAYPNQPMIEYDNSRQIQVEQQKADPQSNYSMFISNHGGSGAGNGYDNLEGQLFGPLPPYLMHSNPEVNDEMGSMNIGGIVSPMNNGNSGPSSHQYNGAAMNLPMGMGVSNSFDDIFVGNNEDYWDQGMG